MDTVPYLLDGPVGGWPPPSTDSSGYSVFFWLKFCNLKVSLLYHNKIRQKNSLSLYLLLFNNIISSFFKKDSCCYGSMSNNILFYCRFQLITYGSGNSFSLIIWMNI